MNTLRQAIKELKAAGYIFYKHGSSHDIYKNAELNKKITLKRHKSFNEDDLMIIRREIAENK